MESLPTVSVDSVKESDVVFVTDRRNIIFLYDKNKFIKMLGPEALPKEVDITLENVVNCPDPESLFGKDCLLFLADEMNDVLDLYNDLKKV